MIRTLSSEKVRRHCGEMVSRPALAGQSKVSMLIFTQQKCGVVNFAFDETGAPLLPRNGHSFFGIGNCSIEVFERTHAPSALVVFGALELSPCSTQVLQGCPHVRLIGPNRIQTGGGNYSDDSETDFQYFHPARSKQYRHEVKLQNCFRMDVERVIS
jgi:hypothetical protein